MNSSIKRIIFVLVGFFAAAALVACGSGSNSSGEANSTNSATTSPVGNTQIEFTNHFTSVQQNLHKVGDNDSQTYGWNLFDSSNIEVKNSDVKIAKVQLQGNVNYKNGEGPFTTFFTITFSDQSTLGFETAGDAKHDSNGGTNFDGTGQIIGGTGSWVGTTGSAKFVGKRSGEIGAPVEATITLDANVPNKQ